MKVTIKLFAAMREAVGQSEVVLDVPPGAIVAQVKSAFCEAFPQTRGLVERSMFAIDTCYAVDNETIPANAEIACLPPVSGG
jgi:molybdopterin converting factor small subunit